MDTSINQGRQDFRIIDIVSRDLPGDIELAMKAKEAIYLLVQGVKPILRYVASPLSFNLDYSCEGLLPRFKTERVIQLDLLSALGSHTASPYPYAEFLFMDEKGYFFSAIQCHEKGTAHFHVRKPVQELPMEDCLFGAVMGSLQKVVKAVKEKREQHLASINEHSEKLDEIIAILRR